LDRRGFDLDSVLVAIGGAIMLLVGDHLVRRRSSKA